MLWPLCSEAEHGKFDQPSQSLQENVMNDRFNPPKDPANRDPITGAPGAHPLGTGVGAAVGGAAVGAATGTSAGPVGTVIGAAAGAIAGGLIGKAAAEKIDPTVETAYWRDNFASCTYVDKGAKFEDYAPAYAYGVHSSPNFAGRTFEDAESELSRDWDTVRGKSSLAWDRARYAVQDAWNRARKAVA
jgi:hypothetical protein